MFPKVKSRSRLQLDMVDKYSQATKDGRGAKGYIMSFVIIWYVLLS